VFHHERVRPVQSHCSTANFRPNILFGETTAAFWTVRNHYHRVLAAISVLLATIGCVVVRHQGGAKDWPNPKSANTVEEFEGAYSNRSVKRSAGPSTDETAQLFDFLTGQDHSYRKAGSQVEIRFDSGSKRMVVRLLDDQGLEIDVTGLFQGQDFDLSKGSMKFYGPSRCAQTESTFLGPEVVRHTSRLYISSTNCLLGKESAIGAGLLFHLVPIVAATNGWKLWPKLAP